MSGHGTEPADERFVEKAQRLLRRDAEELDAATLARLQRARREALTGFDRRAGWWRGLGWQPAIGATAVCATALIAVGLWLGRMPGVAPPVPAAPVSATADPAADLDVALADDDKLEMIENLAFYDWLSGTER